MMSDLACKHIVFTGNRIYRRVCSVNFVNIEFDNSSIR